MACNPTTVFLFPDPAPLTVLAVTSEGGACEPLVSSEPAGCSGNLAPTVTGVPADDSTLPITLELVESGGTDSAGYTVTAGGTCGMHDPALAHSFMTPFDETGDANIRVMGSSIVHCAATKQMLIAGIHLTDQYFRFKRLQLLQDSAWNYDAWGDESELDPADIGAPEPAPGSSTMKCAAIVEAPDGCILMFYLWTSASPATTDFNIACVCSADGGYSWKLLHRKLNDSAVEETLSLRVARSGDWLKLAWLDQAAGELRSIASADSGLSWSDIEETSAITLTSITGTDDPCPWELIGVGGGLFILPFCEAATDWTYHHSLGADGWTSIGVGTSAALRKRTVQNLGAGTPAIIGLGGCVAWGKVWVFITLTDGPGQNDDDQLHMYCQDVRRILQSGPGEVGGGRNEWQEYGALTGQKGIRFYPSWISAADAGGQFIQVHAGIYDLEGAATVAGTIGFRIGGFAPKPVGEHSIAENVGRDRSPVGAHVDDWWYVAAGRTGVQWASPFQRPANGGANTSADTSWTFVSSGAPTVSYSKRYLDISHTPADTAYHTITVGATATDSWANEGSVAYGVFRLVSSSGAAGHLVSSDGFRIRTRTNTGAGSDESDFEIRIGAAAISLYDNFAGSSLGFVTIDTTKWTMVTVAFYNSGGGTTGTQAVLTAWHLDDPFNTLDDVGGTLQRTAVGTPTDTLGFGAIGTGNTQQVRWREVGVIKKHEVWQLADRRVGLGEAIHWLGIPTTPVCVGNNLVASWGGGAAALGDQYTVNPRYLYPAENVFRDGTLLGWRSGGGTPLDPQTLDFEVGDAAHNRSMAQAIYLAGLEEPDVDITLAGDAAFSTGVVGPFSLDTRTFTGIEVDDVIGDTIQFVEGAGVRIPIDGELAHLRIVMATGAATGTIWRVAEHTGGHLRLDADGKAPDLAAAGIAAGDTFDVFLTHGVVSLGTTRRRKYLRVELAAADTATGDHRLAVMQPMNPVTCPIPFQWTHTGAIDPDQAIFQGAGGVSWGYENAPPRRQWTGRLVNDYIRWRETFGYLLDTMSSFGVRPIVIIPDEAERRQLIYGRFQGSARFDHSFWWTTDDGDGEYRYPGGDMSINIVEVL